MNKKVSAIVISSVILMLSLCGINTVLFKPTVTVSAVGITQNGMTFEKRESDKDELILTSYEGAKGNIEIPEIAGGYKVTGIGDNVFYGNTEIKEVILPDSIDYFGTGVFQDSSVVSVNIPKKLIVIPNYSFNNCQELETVEFHDKIIGIANTAFKKTNIEYPEFLKERVTSTKLSNSEDNFIIIKDGWAFDILMIPRESINQICLYDYTGESTDIVFPDNLFGYPITEIGRTFSLIQKQITSVIFPESLQELNVDFSGHRELKSITFMNPNLTLGTKVSFSGTRVENLEIPMSYIPKSLFENCINLKSINFIGKGEKLEIMDSAFKNCTSLEKISFGDGFEKVYSGKESFRNTGFKKLIIKIPFEVGVNAFADCINLTYAEFHNSTISTCAFQNCTSLKDTEIMGNTFVDDMAFMDCTGLENVGLSDEATSKNAFYNSPLLMKINSEEVFDISENDFTESTKELVKKHFSGADEIGFLNAYVKEQAKKIVSELITDDMADNQKVKVLHDYVCNKTEFDYDQMGDRNNHNDAGIFLNDKTVCEGYARALNILLHEAGIETYYLSGVNHAWNIVKLGDNYFHVDSTWDDGETIKYNWFLKSDAEISNSDVNHSSWELFVPSSLHSFQKDTLPKCEYQIGDVNKDGSVGMSDLVTLSNHALGKTKINNGDIFIADMNYDGNVDAFDMVCMRQKLISQ